MGPACLETSHYISLAFRDHLSDTNTYKIIPPNLVEPTGARIKKLLTNWLKQWNKVLNKQERKFLRSSLQDPKITPYGVLYLTMKVHKTPLKTRPIVSCSSTTLQNLGIWVDRQLQQIVPLQPSYLKNSMSLKTELCSLHFTGTISLLTADAVSMYTNIDTNKALRKINGYLRRNLHLFPHIPIAALIDALEIIMRNNVFTFGDTHWQQLSGTAMGTPPAPTYATLYFAIHELTFLAEFSNNIIFYKRYIDDIFAIWRHSTNVNDDATAWRNFQLQLNNYDLHWDISPRQQSVSFLDLTISIGPDNRIATTLYEKALNLYLYIPPHSAHPNSVLTGLIYGNVHRITTLCSDPTNQRTLLSTFYQRLLVRGYSPQTLQPLFQKALSRPTTIQPRNPNPTLPSDQQIFLHLPYHPINPRTHAIQKTWHRTLYHPTYKQPLTMFTNIKKLTVAYSRPFNLGNLLSSRILKNGPPVSSSLPTRITDTAGTTTRAPERGNNTAEDEHEIYQYTSRIPLSDFLATRTPVLPTKANTTAPTPTLAASPNNLALPPTTLALPPNTLAPPRAVLTHPPTLPTNPTTPPPNLRDFFQQFRHRAK